MFLRRVCLQRIVEKQVDRAFELSLEYDTQGNIKENDILTVVTYNPAFRNLSSTLRKNFNILYSDGKVSLFVVYKSSRNLEPTYLKEQ